MSLDRAALVQAAAEAQAFALDTHGSYQKHSAWRLECACGQSLTSVEAYDDHVNERVREAVADALLTALADDAEAIGTWVETADDPDIGPAAWDRADELRTYADRLRSWVTP